MLDELTFDEWPEAFAAALEGGLEIACPHVRGHRAAEHPCVRGISRDDVRPEDVDAIVRAAAGEPVHQRPWLGLFTLRDGRAALVRAWRCGASWQCHRGGSVEVAREVDTLLVYALDDAERRRLGIFLG